MITNTFTASFNETELREVVKKHLENQGYEVTGPIVIDVRKRSEGYGFGEHDVEYLHQVRAEVKLNQKHLEELRLQQIYPDHSSNQGFPSSQADSDVVNDR